jgi:hypothetical protein
MSHVKRLRFVQVLVESLKLTNREVLNGKTILNKVENLRMFLEIIDSEWQVVLVDR